MLRTLEPQNRAKNKNAEADFKNPCSYKMKSVYKENVINVIQNDFRRRTNYNAPSYLSSF